VKPDGFHPKKKYVGFRFRSTRPTRLLHVLPDRFVKIRHYGLLGNRCRKKKLDRCRELLACPEQNTEDKSETWQDALLRLTGIDVGRCPACGEHTMRTVEIIQPARCKGPPRI
jgi:hypothetical protein